MLTKISSLLGKIDISPPVKAPIYEHWATAAGENVSEHTLNLEIHNDTLNVVVDSPMWAHQLIHEQTSVVERMKEHGYHNLSGISIRVKIPASVSNDPPEPIPRKGKNRTVSPELIRLFEKSAENSASEEVKEAFRKLSNLDLNE